MYRIIKAGLHKFAHSFDISKKINMVRVNVTEDLCTQFLIAIH